MRYVGTRKLIALILGVVGVVSGLLSGLEQEANAIPAFARKYGFACNVCHVPGFPKLNDFGNLFRDQGYQLGSDEDLPTYEGITMGFWPVSIRTTVGYQLASVRTDGNNASSGSFGFTGLDILSFGLLHRHLSFGVVLTPSLGSASFGTEPADGDLEAGWVRINSLERFLGVKGEEPTYWMNLRVGKFELDVPFSEKRSPTLNTDIVMYHYQAGTPWTTTLGGLMTNSYADPNDFQLGENQPGLELAGIKPTPGEGYFRYSLNALSNSNLNTDGNPNPDATKVGGGRGVNFYGHVTQSIGGYGIVTGQRIGVFGVYGETPTLANQACGGCPATAGSGKPFNRIGADLSLTYDGQWNLFGAFMHAHDSKDVFASQGIAPAQSSSWNGAFVELDWYPTVLPVVGSPGWLLIYRYDLIRNSRQGNPGFADNYNDVDSHTGMVRYYIHQSSRTDLALHAEYNWYRAKGVGANGGNQYGQTMLVGFDFAY